MARTSAKTVKRERFDWNDVRGLTFADALALLWLERWAVIGVGAVVCALGAVSVLLAPKAYTARAELLVRLGQEYVYQPTIGSASAGATPDMQSVVNAEMRMIGSGAVVRATIEHVGLARLYPEIALAPGAAARKLAAAERAFSEHLALETAPQTPSIALSFAHKDPELAAQALNALIDQYLAHRRDVLVGGEYAALTQQSAEIAVRAQTASAALAKFLSDNQIGDFDSEMGALAARAADSETQLFDAEAQMRAAQARIAELRTQMRTEPEEISLYTESDARRDLVQAQMQRQQLLSHYQDDAPPVREVDRRIAQLNQFLAGGDPPSVTRRGANPVRQAIAQQLYTAEADARAQAGRAAAMRQQKIDVQARLGQMRALEPQFRQLLRERAILDTNAQNFAERAEEARGMSEMLGRSTDNISAVERALPPAQGKSLRMPIALVTLMLAGLLGLSVGLVRGLMRRGFPTPQAAARGLDAPVLAVMPRARAPAAIKPVKAKLSVVKGSA